VVLHQLFEGEILLHPIGKACHHSNELSLLIGHLDVAVGQFVVVKQFGAFCREAVTLLR
jgi:hypothetical protein